MRKRVCESGLVRLTSRNNVFVCPVGIKQLLWVRTVHTLASILYIIQYIRVLKYIVASALELFVWTV